MLVCVNVSTAAAVLAGKVRSGKLPVTITEEWLSGLTDGERAVVANYARNEPTTSPDCINGPVYGETLPDVPEATLDTLLICVRAKVAIRAERAAQQAKDAEAKRALAAEVSAAVLADPSRAVRDNAELCGWVHAGGTSVEFTALSPEAQAAAEAYRPVVREQIRQRNEARKAAEAEANAKREQAIKQAAEAAKRYREAGNALIRQIGTDDQRGRLEDNLLPDDEAERIVRDHLFAELDTFPRYEKLTKDDVEHEANEDADGYGVDCDGTVEFEADDADEMPADPWRQLKAIEKAAPDDAMVTPRYHQAECDTCSGKTIRYSAKVEVEWHGRTFAREYAL